MENNGDLPDVDPKIRCKNLLDGYINSVRHIKEGGIIYFAVPDNEWKVKHELWCKVTQDFGYYCVALPENSMMFRENRI